VKVRRAVFAIALTLLTVRATLACSLCGSLANRATLRQEVITAKYVYAGTVSNPRINAAAANASATDFTVKQVIKSDAARKSQKQITIPRYVSDEKTKEYLVFCDETRDGKLDAYRGEPVKSPAMIEYLRQTLQIDNKDAGKILDLAGKYLDHTDEGLASEAFLEFAKASDGDVLQAAKRLSPAMVRRLLEDPKTPSERLALFVSLLGACGTPDDVDWFHQRLAQPGERFRGAMAGLYAGLVMLKPDDGWKALQETLKDAKRPYTDRLAALTALRFFCNADMKATREQAVTAMKSLVTQEDIADFAVDDLRKWQIWDLTKDVVSLYDRKGFDFPMMRHALLRYSLSCPAPEAKALVAKVRKANPDLVKHVEETLELERAPLLPYNKDSRE
jgi:hypothetical protein